MLRTNGNIYAFQKSALINVQAMLGMSLDDFHWNLIAQIRTTTPIRDFDANYKRTIRTLVKNIFRFGLKMI